LNLLLTFRKYNSATRILGILLANKNSNRVTDEDGVWEFIYSGYAVDTGTSLLYLDELIVNAYYAQVPGATLDPTLYAWTIPCSASLPSLTLTIGSYNAVIPGTYMNSSPTSTGGKWLSVFLLNDRVADLLN
jgi:hypothetical protein